MTSYEKYLRSLTDEQLDNLAYLEGAVQLLGESEEDLIAYSDLRDELIDTVMEHERGWEIAQEIEPITTTVYIDDIGLAIKQSMKQNTNGYTIDEILIDCKSIVEPLGLSGFVSKRLIVHLMKIVIEDSREIIKVTILT